MKIKRSSWHYKLNQIGENHEWGTNLCSYFWNVVFRVFLCIVIPFFFCTLGYLYFTNTQVIPTTIILLFIFLSIGLPWFAIYKLRVWNGEPYKFPNENLFFEFIKAKKAKMCPLIKYID